MARAALKQVGFVYLNEVPALLVLLLLPLLCVSRVVANAVDERLCGGRCCPGMR